MQYADVAFLAARVHSSLLSGVSAEQQDAALSSASEEVDGYLAARYPVPLPSWTDAVRKVVADLAAYDLAGAKAFAVDGRPSLLSVRRDAALKWLKEVRDGLISPTGLSATATPITPPGVLSSDDATSTMSRAL